MSDRLRPLHNSGIRCPDCNAWLLTDLKANKKRRAMVWCLRCCFSGSASDSQKKQDAVECVIFSPACVPAAVDPQQEFGW